MYSAPELLLNDAIYNKKSDIWSVGCILYEITTSKKAFSMISDVLDYYRSQQAFDVSRCWVGEFLTLEEDDRELVSETLHEMLHSDYKLRPVAASLKATFEFQIHRSTGL